MQGHKGAWMQRNKYARMDAGMQSARARRPRKRKGARTKRKLKDACTQRATWMPRRKGARMRKGNDARMQGCKAGKVQGEMHGCKVAKIDARTQACKNASLPSGKGAKMQGQKEARMQGKTQGCKDAKACTQGQLQVEGGKDEVRVEGCLHARGFTES